jgi:hypothetical protein
MNCPRCNSPIEENSVFCGICGNQLSPIKAPGATVAEPDAKTRLSDPIGNAAQATYYGTPRSPMYTPPPPQQLTPTKQDPHAYSPMPKSGVPPAPNPTRRGASSLVFIAIVLLLLVIGVSAGAVALLKSRNNTTTTGTTNTSGANNGAANTPVSAIAFFTDSPNGAGNTDVVKMNITGLAAPPSGSQYDAWMIDVVNEKVFALGPLTKQGQGFALAASSNGDNLLSLGNKLEITQEQGNVSVPTGKVVLAATYPPLAYVHIRHLLLHFNTTPHNVGLLVGLRQQAKLLNSQAGLLNDAVNQNRSFSARCIAQNMINIIEGNHGQHYQALGPDCTLKNVTQSGDGFGLLGTDGYISTAAAHASLAATANDSTPTIKLHAGHVRIAMENMKEWTTTIDQDAQALLNNQLDKGKLQEIVTLSEHNFAGVDTNGDESIDPVPGEAGAVTAYQHGQLMAELSLSPPSA